MQRREVTRINFKISRNVKRTIFNFILQNCSLLRVQASHHRDQCSGCWGEERAHVASETEPQHHVSGSQTSHVARAHPCWGARVWHSHHKVKQWSFQKMETFPNYYSKILMSFNISALALHVQIQTHFLQFPLNIKSFQLWHAFYARAIN